MEGDRSSQQETRLKRRHLSTSMSAQVIAYLRLKYPAIDLNDIPQTVGLPLSFLESNTNWISIGAFLRLIRFCVLRTGEDDLAYRVGLSAMEGPVMNRAVRIFARSASTASLFHKLSILSQFFNKITVPQFIAQNGNTFVVRLEPNFEGLDHDDKDDLRDFSLFTAENARGVYEALPTAQDLPKGRATIKLVERVDDIPVFEISVYLPELKEPSGRWMGALIGVVGGSVTSLLLWQQSSESLLSTLTMGGTVSLFLYLLYRIRQLQKSSERLTLERTISATFHEKVLQDSEQKYSQLLVATERLEKLTESYRRFVPLEFLELIGAKSVFEVKPGVRKEHILTVLFLDLRKSTELVTEQGNDTAFVILNRLNQALTTEIRKRGGLVDKFTGDGIMAVFKRSPQDALLAADACIRTCRNEFPWAKLSIGFSCGNVLFGAVGSESDLRLTAQGDAVHLAARLESMNRQFETEILIDQGTAQMLGEDLSSRSVQELGPQLVKGFPQPVKILSIQILSHMMGTGISAKS